MKLRLPHTLTAQFALAVLALALLIVAGGATSIYALSGSTDAVRALSEQRLARLQDAQDLVQHTLLIERQALQLAGSTSAAEVRRTLTSTRRSVPVMAAEVSGSKTTEYVPVHRSATVSRKPLF